MSNYIGSRRKPIILHVFENNRVIIVEPGYLWRFKEQSEHHNGGNYFKSVSAKKFDQKKKRKKLRKEKKREGYRSNVRCTLIQQVFDDVFAVEKTFLERVVPE